MVKKIYILAAVLIINFIFMNERGQAQWLSDMRLTNSAGSSNLSLNNARTVAVSGNAVHAVWYDDRDGNYEIYYKRSTDGGASWGADVRLTNNAATSTYPSIAVEGMNVNVVWQDDRDGVYEIFNKRSTDGGITWGQDTRLTNSNPNNDWYPSIFLSGTLAIIVYTGEGFNSNSIFFIRSTDGGINWNSPSVLVGSNFDSWSPSIAYSSLVCHVVWRDNRDGNYEIYYRRSTVEGQLWGPVIRLTNNAAESYIPSVAAFGAFVHVAWYDERDGAGEIYYKRSTDYGSTWEQDRRLTNDLAFSGFPSIAAFGSKVHLVWYDARDGNFEIYHKRSTDDGINWGSDVRLTNNADVSWNPSLAFRDSTIHVVWSDNRDGNFEVYHKRNPTGQVGIKNISTEIPAAFSLSQNYPNPFNPGTVVRFDVMRSQTGALGADKVVLKVYNVMGREVETLVNEQLAPGTYEAKFDGSKLNSGVYFYRLQSGSFTETKQMMLIK